MKGCHGQPFRLSTQFYHIQITTTLLSCCCCCCCPPPSSGSILFGQISVRVVTAWCSIFEQHCFGGEGEIVFHNGVGNWLQAATTFKRRCNTPPPPLFPIQCILGERGRETLLTDDVANLFQVSPRFVWKRHSIMRCLSRQWFHSRFYFKVQSPQSTESPKLPRQPH